jgi:hypothetical protein
MDAWLHNKVMRADRIGHKKAMEGFKRDIGKKFTVY